MALFTQIASDQRLQLQNREKFKQVEGDLFEFKLNSEKMRLFAFRHRMTWYLVCGMSGKKENQLPPAEVERASILMNQAKAVLGCA